MISVFCIELSCWHYSDRRIYIFIMGSPISLFLLIDNCCHTQVLFFEKEILSE